MKLKLSQIATVLNPRRERKSHRFSMACLMRVRHLPASLKMSTGHFLYGWPPLLFKVAAQLDPLQDYY